MHPLRIYVGVSETLWNGCRPAPGAYACVAPVYGKKPETKRKSSVFIPDGTRVILDSGAFSDGPSQRLTFEGALGRQLEHAEQYHYLDKVTHVANYDCLRGVDEHWQPDGTRIKKRGTEQTAWSAVDVTIAAAEWMASNRHKVSVGLILSAQGVSPDQYLMCAKRVISCMDIERDLFGFGGFCITGMMPTRMMPTFRETISRVIPYAASQGVKAVHVWGVLYAPAIAWLLHQADKYNIAVSTDSSGPSTRPTNGSWGYDDWTDPTYKRRAAIELRGLDRARHVEAVRRWLADFRGTPEYMKLCAPAEPTMKQLSLFEMAA